MTPEQPERDEQVLKKLSKLFADTPETEDADAADEELSVHGVDVERLSRRIRGIVESAAEKERLAWLDDYQRHGIGAKGKAPRRTVPRGRADRLRMIDELQQKAAEQGLPAAVGFKKVKLEALSDDDLGRIIEALLDADETEQSGD
jgi:hypothetical protein